MFADPLSNLMLVILLFFLGLLVMFVFVVRSLNLITQNIEETRKQLGISLMDMERKLSEISRAVNPQQAGDADDFKFTGPNAAKMTGSAISKMENLSDIFDSLPQQDVSRDAFETSDSNK